jgi:hypothetical protein
MNVFVKTITLGPTTGGIKVAPDRVDTVINETLEKIQQAGQWLLKQENGRAGSSWLNNQCPLSRR